MWRARRSETGTVRFGGGRLETQVMLCAGRLPYFLIGIIGSLEDAKRVYARVEQFLNEELNLDRALAAEYYDLWFGQIP